MIHAENRLAPRMVLIITNHEYRRKLEQTFQNFRIPIYYQCQGHGTAPSEMLDIFGLSGSSRLLTIGLLPKFLVRDLLDALQQRIPLHKARRRHRADDPDHGAAAADAAAPERSDARDDRTEDRRKGG